MPPTSVVTTGEKILAYLLQNPQSSQKDIISATQCVASSVGAVCVALACVGAVTTTTERRGPGRSTLLYTLAPAAADAVRSVGL